MPTLEIREQSSGTRVGIFCPRNGIQYTVIAVPWKPPTESSMGVLGYVIEGWLVTCGLNGRSYLLQKSGYLSQKYIAEHFHLLIEDAEHVTYLISELTGRPCGTPDEERTE